MFIIINNTNNLHYISICFVVFTLINPWESYYIHTNQDLTHHRCAVNGLWSGFPLPCQAHVKRTQWRWGEPSVWRKLGQPSFITPSAWEMHSDLCSATQQSLHKAPVTRPRGGARSHKAGRVCLPGPPPLNQGAVRGARHKMRLRGHVTMSLLRDSADPPRARTHTPRPSARTHTPFGCPGGTCPGEGSQRLRNHWKLRFSEHFEATFQNWA